MRATPWAVDGYTDSGSHRVHGYLRCAHQPQVDSRSYGAAHQCRISSVGTADALPMDEEMESRNFFSRRIDATDDGASAGDPIEAQIYCPAAWLLGDLLQ